MQQPRQLIVVTLCVVLGLYVGVRFSAATIGGFFGDSPPTPTTYADVDRATSDRVQDLWDTLAVASKASPPNDDATVAEHPHADGRSRRTGAVEVDHEWERFPRHSWSFPRSVVFSPDRIKEEDLFRHMELNPSDRYIEKGLRAELAMIIVSSKSRLHGARGVLNDTRRRELTALISAGRTTVVPSTPMGIAFPKETSARKGAFIMPSLAVPEAHWAPLEELPMTKDVTDYIEYEGVDLGGKIIEWFRIRTICPEGRAAKLLFDLQR